jgi:hypothetical protein
MDRDERINYDADIEKWPAIRLLSCHHASVPMTKINAQIKH